MDLADKARKKGKKEIIKHDLDYIMDLADKARKKVNKRYSGLYHGQGQKEK